MSSYYEETLVQRASFMSEEAIEKEIDGIQGAMDQAPVMSEAAEQILLRHIAVLRTHLAGRNAPACPCECNSGGFCGGCSHAGCGGRK